MATGRSIAGLAGVLLGLIMTLKFGFAGCLAFAHQGFLKMKGLVLIVLTSMLAGIIVSFLHGLVPGILVSITDAIAAIIVGGAGGALGGLPADRVDPVDREVDQTESLRRSFQPSAISHQPSRIQ